MAKWPRADNCLPGASATGLSKPDDVNFEQLNVDSANSGRYVSASKKVRRSTAVNYSRLDELPTVEDTAALRRAVVREVELAIARGRKRAYIGYAVNNPSICANLDNGHVFRHTTLLHIYDILTKDRRQYEATSTSQTASVLT